MRSSDGEGRSMRSDALYPALSGEWEVPVTRNAKITPVNEGVGGGVGGPPLRGPLWQGPPLPVIGGQQARPVCGTNLSRRGCRQVGPGAAARSLRPFAVGGAE